MTRRYRRYFNTAFLSIFFLLTLSINYFHTENDINCSNFCPACQFQNSTLATATIPFFHLPQLNILRILRIFESSSIHQLFFISPSSRSPPQI